MIKFVAAAIWICAATLGAVFFAFQSGEKSAQAATAEPTVMGGLDYVKTEVISVPMIRDASVEGYFLSRLVYTVDPKDMKKLVIPADALITDVVYSYVYGSPQLDFSKTDKLDLDAFRAGIRKAINDKVGQDLVKDVMIEQIDYLTKADIRANTAKRRINSKAGAKKDAPPSEGHEAAPAAH